MSTKAQTLRLAAFIALRIAKSRSKNALSVVTALSVIGVACGVFALTVVLAVSDGFEKAFQDRILGIYPHLMVTRTRSVFHDWQPTLATIKDTPGVLGVTPLSHHRMMASRGPFRADASIQGVDPATLPDVIDIADILREGDLDRLTERVSIVASPNDANHFQVKGLVARSAHTFVVTQSTDAKPVVRHFDDHIRTPPAGRLTLRALDLRPADERAVPIRLSARNGRGQVATIHNDGTTFSNDMDFEPGLYRLEPTGENVDLKADHHYALVIHAPPGASPTSHLAGDPQPANTGDARAHVRIIDIRPSGPPAHFTTPDNDRPFASTAPDDNRTFTPLTPVQAALPAIFLGRALANKLRAKVGDALSFVTILRGLHMAGLNQFGTQPSSVRFEIAGIFESGFYEQDVSLAITNLRNSERFMNAANVVEALAVRTEDILTLDRTRTHLKRALDPMAFEDLLEGAIALDAKLQALADMEFEAPLTAPSAQSPLVDHVANATRAVDLLRFQGAERANHAQFQIFDWRDKNANHLSVIELQKIVLTIFFFIIVLVGSFVVVGSQIMIINEKTADIAILKTIGATGPFVRLVFTLQGLFVASIGVAVGLASGLLGVWLLEAVDYELEASIYYIDRLPVAVDAVALVWVALGALACTLLTTQISAGRAAAREPVAGLRQVD